ncbi:MAG TPA: aminotransferase class III-fold pyridoxal phosphate-dependent enzyme, partial [Acidobacteriaceae bacterium]
MIVEDIKSNINSASIGSILAERASSMPGARLYVFINEREQVQDISYGQFYRGAARIAAGLCDRTEPGDRVMLLYPTGPDYLAAFLGCQLAGVIAVPCYPPRNGPSAKRVRGIIADCTPALALTAPGNSDQLRATVECPTWWEAGFNAAEPDIAFNAKPVLPDDIAFLQYTSGSTGDPKGVMVSHGNLLANAACSHKAFHVEKDSVCVTWLPPYHDMGLIGCLLQSLYSGISCVVLSPGYFLQQPIRWLAAISEYKATHSGGPNFAYDLCVRKITEEQKRELDLSSWQIAFCGAEPIRLGTLERFQEEFASCGLQPGALFPCYGLAEATLLVSCADKGQGQHVAVVDSDGAKSSPSSRRVVASGKPLLEKVLIVDPDSLDALGEDQVGEIWLAGDQVAKGYWNKPELSQEVFSARLSWGSDDYRYLRTGDLGFMRDGQLFVSGRLKDLIILGGRNLYPQDVEAAAFGSDSRLRPDGAAAFADEDGEDGERLILVQELEFRQKPSEELIRSIVAAVFEYTGAQPDEIILTKPGAVPRTSSGKIRRRQCKTEWRNGTLPVVSRWNRNGPESVSVHLAATPHVRAPLAGLGQSEVEIRDWLCERLAQRLGLKADLIDPDQTFFSYGVNSLAAIEISGALVEWLGRPLDATLCWDYPTPNSLAHYLAGGSPSQAPSARRTHSQPSSTDGSAEPIAIVGVGCRFPGVDNPRAFWQLLREGVDAIRPVPEKRKLAGTFVDDESAEPYTRLAGFLDEVDRFDCDLFGISPLEAASIDPQQRLMLEVSWEALEDGGIPAAQLAGSQAGIFIGISGHDYDLIRYGSNKPLSLYDATGSAFSIAANRLSYLLDLRGPSMAVDTACSSSLVAVHLACQSLRQGESDLAIAGGVNLILSSASSTVFAHAGMLSPDGRCKAFDASANGYVRGEGCGAVILKRLSDAQRDGDTIRCVILGSAVHQDGRSNGLTAPNGMAQTEVIRRALEQAGLAAYELSYIEAHGTGTSLGDPIEFNALKAALQDGSKREQPCMVASVKTNIGHLEAAAGIAGLIRTVLSLEHEAIAPHLHLKQLNAYCSEQDSPIAISTTYQPWGKNRRRYAGISSFGFGGTLAHVIVGDAPPPVASTSSDSSVCADAVKPRCSYQLLALSAKSPAALETMSDQLAAQLREASGASLEDVAYTLQTGRNQFGHRRMLVCSDRDEAAAVLASRKAQQMFTASVAVRSSCDVVFMFPGQGSQRIGMARELYRGWPVFRELLDACASLLLPLIQSDLRTLLCVDKDAPQAEFQEQLGQTALAQPVLFAVEYSLARTLMELGVQPSGMIGHSLGEYVAACLAGVFSLEDALAMVALRGQLMQQQSSGAMISVGLSEQQIAPYLRSDLDLAAVNGTQRCVVAGSIDAVDALVLRLTEADVPCRRLQVSHAFHSVMMEPVLHEFQNALAGFQLNEPSLPFISNVSGDWISGAEATDPAYWARHLRLPVRFANGLATITKRVKGKGILLEVGPGNALQSLARQQLSSRGDHNWQVLPALALESDTEGGASEVKTLLSSIGHLWLAGCSPDWTVLHRGEARTRIALPTYPFERQRYWIESAPASTSATKSSSLSPKPISPSVVQERLPMHSSQLQELPSQNSSSVISRKERIETKLLDIVAELLQIKPSRVDVRVPLLELGADSLVLVRAVRQIEDFFQVRLTIRQLFEELTSISEVAAYLDRHLPATWRDEGSAHSMLVPQAETIESATYAHTPQSAERPSTPVMPLVSAPASVPLPGVENVIAQQIDLMKMQLRLLGSGAGDTTIPAAAVQANDDGLHAVRKIAPLTSGAAKVSLEAAPLDRFDPYSKLGKKQQEYRDRFIADYIQRTAHSKAYAEKHKDVLADYRALAGFRFSAKDPIFPLSLKELFYPIVSARSSGGHVVDIDGNDYVDTAMGFGVALFGHSAPFIQDALKRQLDLGYHLGPQSELAGDVAAMMHTLTGMERVAFCNSGTEAMMLAVRLARTRTGRKKIAQFSGSYHGWADGTLVMADPDRAPNALPVVPGLQAGSADNALVLEYGSDHALTMIRQHANELAAVLVEPVQSRRPEFQPKEFLHALRALTRELGITLIFDEMITGFRLHPGGAQGWFGVRADLAAYGKAAGGGMPIGMVAGDSTHMDGIDGGQRRSAETTFFAGTFSKHPLALASTHAVLKRLLSEGPALQEELNRRTARMVERLNDLFLVRDVPVQAVHCGSLYRINCLHNLDLFFYHLIAHGLYVWEGRTMYLSTAHADADIDFIVSAFEATLDDLCNAGFFPGASPSLPVDRLSDSQTSGAIAPPARSEVHHGQTHAGVQCATVKPMAGPVSASIAAIADGRNESLASLKMQNGQYAALQRQRLQDAGNPEEDLRKFVRSVKESVAELREGGFIRPLPDAEDATVSVPL